MKRSLLGVIVAIIFVCVFSGQLPADPLLGLNQTRSLQQIPEVTFRGYKITVERGEERIPLTAGAKKNDNIIIEYVVDIDPDYCVEETQPGSKPGCYSSFVMEWFYDSKWVGVHGKLVEKAKAGRNSFVEGRIVEWAGQWRIKIYDTTYAPSQTVIGTAEAEIQDGRRKLVDITFQVTD